MTLFVTGASKYVEFTEGTILINGEILYIKEDFRVNDEDLQGAPGSDFGDYYVYLRPNRKVMQAYYDRNWEYILKSLAANDGVLEPPAELPDEFCVGKIEKRDNAGVTELTAIDVNRGKRLIGTKDISDDTVLSASIVAFDGGSVSAPSITFEADTDTGIYQTTPGAFSIGVNGANKITVGNLYSVFQNNIQLDDDTTGLFFGEDQDFSLSWGSATQLDLDADFSVTGDVDASGGINVGGATGAPTGSIYAYDNVDGANFGYTANDKIDIRAGAMYLRQSSDWRYQFQVSNFSPYNDNVTELGLSSKRWEKLWATDIDTAGNVVVGGVVRADGGTEAAPGIAWDADANTGFYQPSDNDGKIVTTHHGTEGFAFLPGHLMQIEGKEALDGNDNYLRLNQNGDFTNGIFTPNNFRVDGDVTFNGTLSSVDDPSAGDEVGDRDYNDARYFLAEADTAPHFSSHNPHLANSTTSVAVFDLYVVEISVPQDGTVLNGVRIYGIGSSYGARSSIYNSSGTRLANSTQNTSLGGGYGAWIDVPFNDDGSPTAETVDAGLYWIGVQFNSGSASAIMHVVTAGALLDTSPTNMAAPSSITVDRDGIETVPVMVTY